MDKNLNPRPLPDLGHFPRIRHAKSVSTDEVGSGQLTRGEGALGGCRWEPSV